MHDLSNQELRKLFTVVRENDEHFHLFLLVSLLHGLRVNETLAIRGKDVQNGKLFIQRLKNSRATLQSLREDSSDVLFDESPLIRLAATCAPDEYLFKFSQWTANRWLKTYGAQVGLHPKQLHCHVFKHCTGRILWEQTRDLNCVQDGLGHKAQASSLVYLRRDAAKRAEQVMTEMNF
jgi:integrase